MYTHYYEIIPGDVDPANSTVTVLEEEIPADNSTPATLTYTAKDRYGNGISDLQAFTLQVKGKEGADPESVHYTEFASTKEEGVHTSALTASKPGNFELMPLFDGNPAAKETAQLKAKQLTITGLVSDGFTFQPDEGFPTTGYTDATFQIQINGKPPESGWKFSSNAGWVTVTDNGEVTFSGEGQLGSTVKITAESEAGGYTLSYSFTVTKWFYGAPIEVYQEEAETTCNNYLSGYHLSNALEAAGRSDEGNTRTRAVGSMWGEWGVSSGINRPSTRYLWIEKVDPAYSHGSVVQWDQYVIDVYVSKHFVGIGTTYPLCVRRAE